MLVLRRILTFSINKNQALLMLLFLHIVFLLSPNNATAALKTITVSWDYNNALASDLAGFVLYQDGLAVCETTSPENRSVSCEVDIANDPISFTMTAYDYSGNESVFSTPFVLQPPPIITSEVIIDNGGPEISSTVQPPPDIISEIIIDNGNPETSSTGTWSQSSGPNSFGTQSLYSKSSNGQYIYEASTRGIYEVFLWWTQWSSRCQAVPIEIYDDNYLIDTVFVNQKINGGTWNSLGLYDFSGVGSVVIVSEGGSCSTSADAVKFHLQSSPDITSEVIINNGGPEFSPITQPLPDITSEMIIDNDDPETSSTGTWSQSSGPNSFGTQSLYSKSSNGQYIYEASIRGIYEVSLWWTQYSSRCLEVPIEIYDDNYLIDTVFVNQKINGGTWNSLGLYDFSGIASVVVISEGNSCSTSADAVKFH